MLAFMQNFCVGSLDLVKLCILLLFSLGMILQKVEVKQFDLHLQFPDSTTGNINLYFLQIFYKYGLSHGFDLHLQFPDSTTEPDFL